MSTYEDFKALCESIGSDPMTEESAILSIGRDLLPPCAIVVLDKGEPTEEYWEFLCAQTSEAQAEHDAEYVAGHEWHEGQKF